VSVNVFTSDARFLHVWESAVTFASDARLLHACESAVTFASERVIEGASMPMRLRVLVVFASETMSVDAYASERVSADVFASEKMLLRLRRLHLRQLTANGVLRQLIKESTSSV